MKYIAVLLTVFNRKDTTLRCLSELLKQSLPSGYVLDVFLTNDGCTDGTPECVKSMFPSVHIINGDGTLFWNRGMIKAWTAASEKRDYDFYFWLNDDTILFDEALMHLLLESETLDNKSVLVGATCDSKTRMITTYSGYGEDDKKLDVNGKLQVCDHFNGNIVLVPSYIYHQIGTMDYTYRHSVGDFDYGFKLNKSNLNSYVSSNFIGICDRHNNLPKYADPSIAFCKRFANYFSPLGAAPRDNFIYFKKKYGLFIAIKHVVRKFLNCLFPNFFLKRNMSDSFFFNE